MKLKYFVILLIPFITLIAQNNQVQLIDKGFIFSLENEKVNYNYEQHNLAKVIDYYEYTNPSNNQTYKLPSKTLLIAIPSGSHPNISVVSYSETVLENAIPQINPKLILSNDSTLAEEYDLTNYCLFDKSDSKIIEIIGYRWYRDKYCVQVRINTHYFDRNKIIERHDIKIKVEVGQDFKTNAYSKDSEFASKVIYNYDIEEQFNNNGLSTLKDTTGKWINYNSQYIKIKIGSDGLYKISKRKLEECGINTCLINPKTFRLLESGKEISIYIAGQEDNSFDETDYILFYGHMNYATEDYRKINSSKDDYREYLNKYTDTTYYFLTWNGVAGKQIPVINVSENKFDTLNYYKQIDHIEKNQVFFNAFNDELENQLPSYKRNKTWYYSQNDWLYSGTIKNYSFDVPDLILEKYVQVYFKGVSGGSSQPYRAHNITMKVNGVLLDSLTLDRYNQVLLTGRIKSNLLTSTKNTLRVQNYNNNTSPNVIAVDWYEIEYPKKLKLINGKLLFEVYNDVISSLKTIKIENASSNDYEIIKVKPKFKKITNYLVVNNILTFSDTVNAGDKYLICNKSNVSEPIDVIRKQFINLRKNTGQTDYIAITHNKFMNAAKDYVSTISDIYRLSTELVNIQDIFDEFSYGYPDPAAIRLYTATAFSNKVAPKASYLVLIGDANYDYKDYFKKSTGVTGGRNYVPSYGIPVSDNWFSVWDETLMLPQLKVGRIPVNESKELDYYLSKIKNNVNSRLDRFNKQYLFFSGGPSNDSSQIKQLKAVNDFIIDKLITPAPISGLSSHFYKTVNPQTDFGPYSSDEISKKIKESGVFISYLGHSGTATWDNSISKPSQLFNYSDKNPLITDFGCSTNKFAEPDIICFGERFLLQSDGQAIGYIGNSSLGFTSTAFTLPKYFYSSIVTSETKEIGEAIIQSKAEMFKKLGNSPSYNIFALTNTLIGDPAVRIGIPTKPNLVIKTTDVVLSSSSLTTELDSVQIKLTINNWGIDTNDSVIVVIQHYYNGKMNKVISKRIKLPSISDGYYFQVEVKNKPGNHELVIKLDEHSEIDELYEDDNKINYTFNVSSSEIRDLLISRVENSYKNKIAVINPTTDPKETPSIIFHVANDEKFSEPKEYKIAIDTFRTEFNLTDIISTNRIWLRYKMNNSTSNYSPYRSIQNKKGSAFLLIDSVSFANQNIENLVYENSYLKIAKKHENISVTSAGWYAGATCVISKNGINLLSNTYFAGIGIVVFNPITMAVDTSAWYSLFGNSTNVQLLTNFINMIPNGKLVVMGVSDDAANNISTSLKAAIKTLGSSKIDQLQFRGSWALIGKKGASQGSAREIIRGPYDGLIYLDSTFTVAQEKGKLETNFIGPVKKWKQLTIEKMNNTFIKNYLIGKQLSGNLDTLMRNNQSFVDLSKVDAKKYPFLKVVTSIEKNYSDLTDGIISLEIDYIGTPELGTNYQVVSVSKDSLEQGEKVNLNFAVYNVGESTASNFNVRVDLVKKDNTKVKLFEEVVDSIQTEKKKDFSLTFTTDKITGSNQFQISIDTDNGITELYKDNNFYSVPFFVKQNNKPASLKLTIDGNDIINGDFISSKPNIKIELNDESLIPITDTNKVLLYLNNKRIYFANNTNILNYNYSSANPKMVVNYLPTLADGNYTLKVVGKNATDQIIDSTGIVKKFTVQNGLQLLNVFNYPNPFKDDTYFTFKLTQLPAELRILIYTIAGRKIKEIKLGSGELRYDFNRIFWDGRDEDGDLCGNGVYIYKIISQKGGEKTEQIQKLTILR